MFIQELGKDPGFFFGMVLVITFSICLHELAHGLTAVWLGDRTPIEEGRITLSPFVHMGLISLICLLISGIAWGAMPVNERKLRGRYGVALVAAAGPLTNVLLAALALIGLGLWMRLDPRPRDELSQMAANARQLLWLIGVANVLLALFNLLPIPPLDGSNILRSLIPSFGRTWKATLHAMPGMYVQMTVVAFCAAGWLISPFAGKTALRIVHLTRGW
jgi:Zn-dependent protease